MWLIGTGPMALEYVKVLEAIGSDFSIIGRSESSCLEFEKNTGYKAIPGGIDKVIEAESHVPEMAIVAVGVEQLFSVTKSLLLHGVKRILVEKPGALFKSELVELIELSEAKNSKAYIAYNRRFFASVEKCRELVAQEGGVTSFHFDFTEWSHIIQNHDKPSIVLNRWFLSNSTHVADLAFHLGGRPKDISCFSSGSLKWHESASVFSGAGVTNSGALFNYSANWESAGRWGVEILTKEHKYILRPMEKLSKVQRGTVLEVDVEIDDYLDTEFKPGLFKQVQAFINEESNVSLCSLQEQLSLYSTYCSISGYKDE
ncbi:myo-inositol 2-dehydrogenase [Vibrio tasmaniensis ZS-17]|uniref:hypothetical protein n=1 Tax=Vibrio TaxID=662 RepID=UPI0002EA6DB9|nr:MULTISPECIES: hypothetical protein [Vibrio]OED69554.1 myo-inositol 2-dehydrogenase [Vibrio tasmaniensis ZS-17]PMH99349.1 myo-inositol 2-dehydrogenase [Vibrio lentus]